MKSSRIVIPIVIFFLVLTSILTACAVESTSQSATMATSGNTTGPFAITQGTAGTIELNEPLPSIPVQAYFMQQLNDEEYNQWLKPTYHIIRIIAPKGSCVGFPACPATIVYQIKPAGQ